MTHHLSHVTIGDGKSVAATRKITRVSALSFLYIKPPLHSPLATPVGSRTLNLQFSFKSLNLSGILGSSFQRVACQVNRDVSNRVQLPKDLLSDFHAMSHHGVFDHLPGGCASDVCAPFKKVTCRVLLSERR